MGHPTVNGFVVNGSMTCSVTATDADAIASAVWGHVIDQLTAQQVLKVALAALAGKRAGLGTTAEAYYDNAGASPVITLTSSDNHGNGVPVVTP